MDRKAELIEKILEIEIDWFQRVRTLYPTRCQESPDAFKLVRGSAFESWSEETLSRYLSHLTDALEQGRNLMTEKYARMDDLIPCLNSNPVIDGIVRIESEWMKEVIREHPHVFGGQPSADFGIYLRSELETYSNSTLESYFDDIQEALAEGRNSVKERYHLMFQRLGYNSLAELEQQRK